MKIEFSLQIKHKIKHKAAPKKMFVEIMPADDPEDAMNNLRTAEDSDKKFGLQDLSYIIEKMTQSTMQPFQSYPMQGGFQYPSYSNSFRPSRFKEMNQNDPQQLKKELIQGKNQILQLKAEIDALKKQKPIKRRRRRL